MANPQSNDLDDLALLAELARPLVHECNNFLNNLFLQLAISQNDLPEFLRADWERVRLKGKRLSALLQEWQGQHRPIFDAGAKTEVLPLVEEIVREFNSRDSSVHIIVGASASARLAGSVGPVKRLLCLVLRHAIAKLDAGGHVRNTLEIQFAKAGKQIIFRIHQVGPAQAIYVWTDFASAPLPAPNSSLLIVACKSLTERLGGTLAVECPPENQLALVLKLPALET